MGDNYGKIIGSLTGQSGLSSVADRNFSKELQVLPQNRGKPYQLHQPHLVHVHARRLRV